jgi:hypothetical protein
LLGVAGTTGFPNSALAAAFAADPLNESEPLPEDIRKRTEWTTVGCILKHLANDLACRGYVARSHESSKEEGKRELVAPFLMAAAAIVPEIRVHAEFNVNGTSAHGFVDWVLLFEAFCIVVVEVSFGSDLWQCCTYACMHACLYVSVVSHLNAPQIAACMLRFLAGKAQRSIWAVPGAVGSWDIICPWRVCNENHEETKGRGSFSTSSGLYSSSSDPFLLRMLLQPCLHANDYALSGCSLARVAVLSFTMWASHIDLPFCWHSHNWLLAVVLPEAIQGCTIYLLHQSQNWGMMCWIFWCLQVPSYGILTNGQNMQFYKYYTNDAGEKVMLESELIQVHISADTTWQEARKHVEPVVGRLVHILRAQAKAFQDSPEFKKQRVWRSAVGLNISYVCVELAWYIQYY